MPFGSEFLHPWTGNFVLDAKLQEIFQLLKQHLESMSKTDESKEISCAYTTSFPSNLPPQPSTAFLVHESGQRTNEANQ